MSMAVQCDLVRTCVINSYLFYCSFLVETCEFIINFIFLTFLQVLRGGILGSSSQSCNFSTKGAEISCRAVIF